MLKFVPKTSDETLFFGVKRLEHQDSITVGEGELKKRIKECLPDYWRQTEGNNAIVWALDEAKKEYPTDEKFRQAIIMVENDFPDSRTFSKRYILTVLKETLEKKRKWFGVTER